MDQNYAKFFAAACIILGALAAALISIPLSYKLTQGANPIIITAMTLLGALIGYRRRNSRAFFYAALLAILLISSLFVRTGQIAI